MVELAGHVSVVQTLEDAENLTNATTTWNVFNDEPGGGFVNYSGPMDARNDPTYQKADEILTLYLTPAVLIIGSVGNLLNMIVLWGSKSLHFLPYVILRGLAVADFCAIPVFATFLGIILTVDITDVTVHLARFQGHVFLFLFNSLACTSNLLVMVVTMDRWWAICHPLRALPWRTHNMARVIVTITFILSFLLNIPECFAYEVVGFKDTTTNKTFYSAEWNEVLFKNQWYSHVWPLTVVVISKVLPIASVTVLNPMILLAYVKGQRKRRELTNFQGSNRDLGKQENEERHLSMLLMLLSSIFVICIIPMAVLLIIDKMVPQSKLLTNVSYQIFRLTANLLELVNMSVNFFLYSVSNNSFRKALRGVFSHSFKSFKRAASTLQSSGRGLDTAATSVRGSQGSAMDLQQFTGLETSCQREAGKVVVTPADSGVDMSRSESAFSVVTRMSNVTCKENSEYSISKEMWTKF